MNPPLRFAIVGCGTIARFHVRALAETPDTTLVALVGRSLDAPSKLKEELALEDVAVFCDLPTALQQVEIDVVIVCTPSGDHLGPALLAAKAGKHVVVEKPLEITLERCDQIIDACRHAGVRLCTVFPLRFADASLALKSANASNRFGRIAIAETTCKWWRTQEYYDSAEWRGTWTLDGGGALMNQAIHNVDLLQWLMGPVTQVSGFAVTLAHQRIEVEDACVATLRFAQGAIGTITATTAAYPGVARTLAIHGDRGSAVLENDHIVTWQFADERPEDIEMRRSLDTMTQLPAGVADPKAISDEGHRRQLQDFVEAIRAGRPSAIEGAEGRRAVQLIQAIYESCRTGRMVAI